MNTEKKLTKDEEEVRTVAVTFAKKNKKIIAKRLTSKEIYSSEDLPVSVFMAGSPGAGKTEASKSLIAETSESQNILRIDPDELRYEFASYTGTNSYLFQYPVSIFVSCILDYAYKNHQSFILDGTLSKYDVAEKNVNRALNKKRVVQIIYVYQNPFKAWEFVKARERLEGRNIQKNDFIDQYFSARSVVNKLKQKFDKNIKIDLIIKELDGSNKVFKANIDKIDNHISEKFTHEQLTNELI